MAITLHPIYIIYLLILRIKLQSILKIFMKRIFTLIRDERYVYEFYEVAYEHALVNLLQRISS